VVKKTGLGRGMAALLHDAAEPERKSYFLCPIEDIRPHRNQPRKTFAADKLEELAASIREKGIIQPLVVRRKGDHYELIAGERRWRAAQKAGLHDVPVVIQDVSDDTALEMALIENIQREDLNAVEEAEAYQALMDQFDLSQEELAKRVSKDRSTVANFLRLLRLPVEIKRDIIDERLSMGHARALLSLEDADLMHRARGEVVRGHLTVRATEALVKRLKTGVPTRTVKKKMPVELAALEERLKRHFQTKVAIRSAARGGRIEIAYGSREELSRIIDLLSP
jgi:ParB family chromosome partitioning protein